MIEKPLELTGVRALTGEGAAKLGEVMSGWPRLKDREEAERGEGPAEFGPPRPDPKPLASAPSSHTLRTPATIASARLPADQFLVVKGRTSFILLTRHKRSRA